MNTKASGKTPKERLWSWDFIMALGMLQFIFAAFTAQYTVIPEYVLHRGGEEWQLGIVIASFSIATMVVRPFMGRWVGKFGPKRAGIVAGIIFAVAVMLYLPATGVWLMVPVRMLNGVGMTLGSLAAFTAAANLAPASRRGEGMGFASIAVSGGAIWAPLLGYYLLDSVSFTWAFVSLAAAGVASLLCAAAMTSDGGSAPPSRSGPDDDDIPLISKPALFPTFILLTHTVTLAPLITFLPSFADERGLGNPGLFWTLYSSVSIGVMLVSGPMADRIGRASVIIPGLALSAAAMFIFLAVETQSMFLFVAAVYGAAFGMLQPGLQAFMLDRVPARERSSAMATNAYAWEIGESGGALALGPVAGVWGVASTFAIVGAINAGGLVSFVANSFGRSNPILDQEPDDSWS